jgi:cell shape-determining protein MreC
MAKALIGYLSSDLQTTARLTAENRRLRERVLDLEAIVLRLKEENDTLRAAQAGALLDLDSSALQEMQPV